MPRPNKDLTRFYTPIRLLMAACVTGLAGSILLPWGVLNSVLFGVTALLLGLTGFLYRKDGAWLDNSWKSAILGVAAYAAGPFLAGNDLELLLALLGAISLYLTVMFAVGGLVSAIKAAQSSEPSRPPQAAIMFEYCSGVYALAYLAADAFPSVEGFALIVAMVAMGFGFAQLLALLAKLSKTCEGKKQDDRA